MSPFLDSIATIVGVFQQHARGDGDGSGLSRRRMRELIQREFADSLKPHDPQTIEKILQFLEWDGDGNIDFNEFLLLVFRVAKGQRSRPVENPSRSRNSGLSCKETSGSGRWKSRRKRGGISRNVAGGAGGTRNHAGRQAGNAENPNHGRTGGAARSRGVMKEPSGHEEQMGKVTIGHGNPNCSGKRGAATAGVSWNKESWKGEAAGRLSWNVRSPGGHISRTWRNR
uniref:EF-hand domain-containing protein n=1 Tax=Taeniopygia guttata TaxID=59729 RepID=A0A674HP80_TAEGU